MAGVVGLEPTNAGVKVPCLNRLGYTPITPGVTRLYQNLGKIWLPEQDSNLRQPD